MVKQNKACNLWKILGIHCTIGMEEQVFFLEEWIWGLVLHIHQDSLLKCKAKDDP